MMISGSTISASSDSLSVSLPSADGHWIVWTGPWSTNSTPGSRFVPDAITVLEVASRRLTISTSSPVSPSLLSSCVKKSMVTDFSADLVSGLLGAGTGTSGFSAQMPE